MRFATIFGALLLIMKTHLASSQVSSDYSKYHQKVISIEQQIVELEFDSALNHLDELFNTFNFSFRREYKLATSIAISSNQEARAQEYLELGIANGWNIKHIKKSKDTRALLKSLPKDVIDKLEEEYQTKIDQDLRAQVIDMYQADQKMALRNFIRIREKAKMKFVEQKFAPHSEKQLSQLIQILDNHGYPGEQLAGEGIWMSTVLSHHNSISPKFNETDTLYEFVQPGLRQSISSGELHPFEYALMEDWRSAVNSSHEITIYGFLGKIKNESAWDEVNLNREKIGLRSLELRNQLVEVQSKFGINMYLSGAPWRPGKIEMEK
ncbi:MAG: hypothetical protein JXR10_10240 [Cyclobacteriaceae bacterium]